MRSNLKIVIAAMLVALIATAAVAAPKTQKKPAVPKPIKGKAGQTGVILKQSNF
ncbi:hypothetical protein BGZ72_007942, partial [Mortierella alpina]